MKEKVDLGEGKDRNDRRNTASISASVQTFISAYRLAIIALIRCPKR